MLRRVSACRLILPTHRTTTPTVGTTKRHALEKFLNCLSRDDISDENSDSALDDISSRYLFGGVEFFRDLASASRARQGIYRQSSFRSGEKTDQEANGSVRNTGVPGAIVVHSESKNCALAALANCNNSGHTNQPSDYTHPYNPSERREGADSGLTATSRAPQPLQSNNAKIPKRRQKDTLTVSSIYDYGKRHATSSSWKPSPKLVTWL